MVNFAKFSKKTTNNSAIFNEKLRLENGALFIFSMFIFVYFFTQTDPTRTVQRSALCRSPRELSNAYLLAKIGVNTAENEPLEVVCVS